MEVSMKRSLLLFGIIAVLFCGAHTTLAQIPNAGFENWTSGAPDNWFVNNIPGLWSPVSQSGTRRSGNFSIRGEVITTIAPSFMSPQIAVGTDLGGFAWAQRSGNITGYYQFFPATGSGDRIYVLGSLMETGPNGAGVAVGGGYVSGAASSWTQFSVPFTYISAKVPAWSSLQFIIVGPTSSSSTPHLGSYFLLDDLSYSGTASAVDNASVSPQSFSLDQNYPNPFNPSTSIRFSVAQPGHVSLKVYNVLGVEVASLVNEQKDAGTFSTNWNAAGLPSGMYLYRLSVTSDKGQVFDQSKKLMLLK
jgi:hypothetical protein